MKAEHAKAIVEAANDMGVEVTLYEGYSGRSMYGRTTHGVVGDHSDIMRCIAAAAYKLGYDEGAETDSDVCDEEESTRIDGEDFVDNIGRLRLDSMGRQDIVY